MELRRKPVLRVESSTESSVIEDPSLQMSSYNEEFVTLSNSIDDAVEEIDFAKERISPIGGKLGLSSIGVFSNRALGNLSKWLSIPKGLMLELSEDTLNRTVQEQLLRRQYSRFRVGHNPADKKDIIFVQPISLPYIKYSEVLEPVASKALHLKGNILTSDVLRIFFRVGTINPSGQELIIGQHVSVSSLCVSKVTTLMGIYRTMCSNSLLSTEGALSFEVTSENISSSLIGNVIESQLTECVDFVKKSESFVELCIKKVVDEPVEVVLDDVDSFGRVPRSVTKKARVTGDQVKTGKLDYKIPGLDSLETLWDYSNLLTWQCQALPAWSARESAEKGTYAWASSKLSGL